MTAARALGPVVGAPADQPGGATFVEAIAPIRPEVVDSIGHVLGNLFQRMQHLADRTAEGDPLLGDEVRGAVERLDAFLRVVLDYVSLRTIETVPLGASVAVEALVQRLRLVLGTRSRIHVECATEAELGLDPALLAVGFDCLVKSLTPGRPAASDTVVRVAARREASQVVVTACFAKGLVSLSAEADVQRAVAQRIIELHGGALTAGRTASGEVTWEITLPCRV